MDDDAPQPSPEVSAFLRAHRDTGTPGDEAVARVEAELLSRVQPRPAKLVPISPRRFPTELLVAAAVATLLVGAGLGGSMWVEHSKVAKATSTMRDAYLVGDLRGAAKALEGCVAEECVRLAKAVQRVENLSTDLDTLGEVDRAELKSLDAVLADAKQSKLRHRLDLATATSVEDLNLALGEEPLTLKIEGITKVALGDPAIADIDSPSNDTLVVKPVAVGSTTLLVWTGSSRKEFRVTVRSARKGTKDIETMMQKLDEGGRGIDALVAARCTDATLECARHQINAQQTAAALETLRQAVVADPSCTECIALFKATSEQDVAAVAAAAPVVSPPPSTANPITLAEDEIRIGRYDNALKILQKATTEDPACFECFKVLGWVYANNQDPASATSAYTRFLELAPKSHPDSRMIQEALLRAMKQVDSVRGYRPGGEPRKTTFECGNDKD